jgi:excisionase family DNA binding protein
VTDLLLDVIRAAVRAEIDAALDARLAPVAAALRAATPAARGLSPEEWAHQRGVSVWTVRRRIADGSLAHTRIGRRIVIAADAVPTTAEADRIAALADAARAGR